MKKTALLLVLLASVCTAATAQTSLSLSIGGNASLGRFKGLNYVLDRYNETRQGQTGAATITRSMGNMNILTGLSWQAGLHFWVDQAFFYGGISRTGRQATTYAEVTDINGNKGRRDVKYTFNSINYELGIGGGEEKFVLMAGMSFDIAFARAYTKTSTATEYKRVMNELDIGFTPLLDFSAFFTDHLALTFRPYIQGGWFKTDYADLSEAINSATHTNDDEDKRISRNTNFGMMVMLRIMTGDR